MSAPETPLINHEASKTEERTPSVIRTEMLSARKRLVATYSDINKLELDHYESPKALKERIDRGRKSLEENAEVISDEGKDIHNRVFNDWETRLHGVINMDAPTIWEGLSDEERTVRENKEKSVKVEQTDLMAQLESLEKENKPYLIKDLVALSERVVANFNENRLLAYPNVDVSDYLDDLRLIVLEGEEGLKDLDYSKLGNKFEQLLENAFSLNDRGFILPEDPSIDIEDLQRFAYMTHEEYHREYYGNYYDGLQGDWTVENVLPRNIPREDTEPEITKSEGQPTEITEETENPKRPRSRLLVRLLQKLRKNKTN
ncbi:MAG TPA: hypothetical protein VF189_04430 [Patescibacteria group bacterium]